MDQYQSSYTEEALELIAEMETLLLQLEQNAADTPLIQQVFRAMHTLKGNSSMFGFKVIAEFTHHLESIYEFVRSGQQKLTKEIINVSLASLDHLSALVNNESIATTSAQARHKQLSDQVSALVNKIQGTGARPSPEGNIATTGVKEATTGLTDYLIFFSPNKDFFHNGNNPLYFLEEIKSLGECTVSVNTSAVPPFEEIDETQCYLSWTIELKTQASIEEIKGTFEFAEPFCVLEISVKEPFNSQTIAEANVPVAATSVTTLAEPAAAKKSIISSVRVPSERLDTLMSLVSELITLQAKLGIVAEQFPHTELQTVTENLEKISTRLRDNAFNMCLVPINNMLTPFNRLVRDLAGELDKQIDFITEGTETELDKNIMEGLGDPLMHLLRNSIDHGIEAPHEREKAGKSPTGKIVFKAYCSGTNVFIEIKDDGKGMDPEMIRAKAIQKGIIGKDDVLSEKEIFGLIFLPGFSTAEKISEISGRGVGMDVVKRKITDIRGQIKISSQVGQGTTITIKLPLTISIIDGLLIKVDEADFVIPLSSVDRCFELPSTAILNRFTNVIVLDSEQIPFISLGEEFNGLESLRNSLEVIVVYHEERKVALIADCVVGKFQAVLKPLGKYFAQMETVSGATILGDGNIALVLDTSKLIEQYSNKKRFAICQ